MEDLDLVTLEDDPYPLYARLRRDNPVAWMPITQRWFVTRWDDCERLGRADGELVGPTSFHLDEYFGPNILTASGELHQWLRGGVDPPLRPRAVKGYIEQAARPVARAYVAAIRERGGADATGAILERISVRVIGDVLGYRDVSDDDLQRWFLTISAGATNLGDDAAIAAEAERSMAELDALTIAEIERLTSRPDESGLSHMIHSGIGDGPPRTFAQLKGTIRVIILGGLQEPGHGAAASLYGLLQDPAQYEAVVADPAENLPRAVHEGLRWISPFNVTERRALTDIEVGGATIPAGDEIALVLGSANRDETRYQDPDRFDLFRTRQTHAAFGYGAHFCSGHFISRQLEHIMLEEVVAGLPNLRLDPDRAAVVRGFTIRGVKQLPVVWDA